MRECFFTHSHHSRDPGSHRRDTRLCPRPTTHPARADAGARAPGRSERCAPRRPHRNAHDPHRGLRRARRDTRRAPLTSTPNQGRWRGGTLGAHRRLRRMASPALAPGRDPGRSSRSNRGHRRGLARPWSATAARTRGHPTGPAQRHRLHLRHGEHRQPRPDGDRAAAPTPYAERPGRPHPRAVARPTAKPLGLGAIAEPGRAEPHADPSGSAAQPRPRGELLAHLPRRATPRQGLSIALAGRSSIHQAPTANPVSPQVGKHLVSTPLTAARLLSAWSQVRVLLGAQISSHLHIFPGSVLVCVSMPVKHQTPILRDPSNRGLRHARH